MEKKYLPFIIIMLFIFNSCSNEKHKDYYKIKNERDSLIDVMNSLQDKYIFDEVKVITRAKEENTYLPGSDYKLEIFFVGFNKNSFFIEYDSLNKVDTIYPDNYGILNFSKTLKKGENRIEGFLTTNNKFGEEIQGVLHDVISTKDN